MTLASPLRATNPDDRVVRIRPATAAAVFGMVLGLGVGAAYLGGTAAKAASVRAQAQRLDGATSAGFTEEALAAAAGGLDESALAIARRHDPYTIAGGAQRDRQAEMFTARLEQLRARRGAEGLRRANLTTGAAQPFHLAGALDQSRDLDCLTQAAYYEARGEGADGMKAVAQVVLNRVRHPAFPKTVCGVVFQGAARRTGCQFSFTCNGAMRGPVNRAAWSRARDVASRALSGGVYANVGSATHFHTTAVSPGWRGSLIRVGQVGSHVFYRFGARGAAGRYVYSPEPAAPRLIQASTAETRSADAGAVAYSTLVAKEQAGSAPAPAAHAPAPTPNPTAAAPAPARAATPATTAAMASTARTAPSV